MPLHHGVRSDTAIFDLDTGSEIRIDAAAGTAGSWSVAAGSYNVTGPAEVFSLSTDEPSLRITRHAQLMLSGSTLTSVHTSIGETGNSFSFMDVANYGTTWDIAGRIQIGKSFCRLVLDAL